MSDREFVMRRAVAFETVLKDRMEAEGCGLKQLLRHRGAELPKALVEDLYYIADIRNQVAHTADTIPPLVLKRFEETCERARRTLNEYIKTSEFYRYRFTIRAWLSQCPIDLDHPAHSRVTVAVLHQTQDENATEHSTVNFQPRAGRRDYSHAGNGNGNGRYAS